MSKLSEWKENPSIKRFQEYLQIASVHPDIDYEPCIAFLKKQAGELGLPYRVYVPYPEKPVIILTWEGTDPTLPSILLNSHMDVVPVYPDAWIHPPFSGHITEDGKIYGRGAQDMKSVAIQYLEAVRRIKEKGIRLKRTIHMSFVPEEEKSGRLGMQKFIPTDDFRALNVGLSIDEGAPSGGESFYVFNAERSIWHMIITCPGTSGHGSMILPNTAGEKLRVVIDKFMDYRETQKKRIGGESKLTLSDVTTVNLTQLSGGVQSNVVPDKLTVVFDIRLAVDVDHIEFENMVKEWCKEAGDDITIEYESKDPQTGVTKLDNTNPFWVAFKQATDDLNLTLVPMVFPLATDSRYLRLLGISAFGFSPINNSAVLLHSHNEFLHADVFLKGIDIYEKVVPAIANV